ncbi:MAG: hypothetical protein ABSG99_04405 [Sedimentisphaerales bacterium]
MHLKIAANIVGLTRHGDLSRRSIKAKPEGRAVAGKVKMKLTEYKAVFANLITEKRTNSVGTGTCLQCGYRLAPVP